MSLRLLIVTSILLLTSPLLAGEETLWLVAGDFDRQIEVVEEARETPAEAPTVVAATPSVRRAVVLKVGRPGLPQSPR